MLFNSRGGVFGSGPGVTLFYRSSSKWVVVGFSAVSAKKAPE